MNFDKVHIDCLFVTMFLTRGKSVRPTSNIYFTLKTKEIQNLIEKCVQYGLFKNILQGV